MNLSPPANAGLCKKRLSYRVQSNLSKQPPLKNGHLLATASLSHQRPDNNLDFIRSLIQTATFFRSHGCPLYTGLTVVLNGVIWND